MDKKTSVDLQFKLLILLALLEDTHYQMRGMSCKNFHNMYMENKPLWFQVGQVRDTKQFQTRFYGTLSVLFRENIISKTYNATYLKGVQFDEGFYNVLEQLYKLLDIVVYRENGEIQYDAKFKDDTKTYLMLTDEQLKKVAHYLVKFGIAIMPEIDESIGLSEGGI